MRTLLKNAALLSSLMVLLCAGSLAYARKTTPEAPYWWLYWVIDKQTGLPQGRLRVYTTPFVGSPIPTNRTISLQEVDEPICYTTAVPESEWLVVTTQNCGETALDFETTLYTVHATSGAAHRLTELAGGEWFDGASPDGEWIYFNHDAINGQYSGDLYRVRPNGNDLQRLTYTPDFDEDILRWSPDGHWIYLRFGYSGQWSLYALARMHPDGSDFRILGGIKANQTFLEVSPNGKWIVYGSNLRRGLMHDRWLYRAKSDGSDPRRIFPITLSYSSYWQRGYTWSADGEWLIFAVSNGNDYDLIKLRVKDGLIQRLVATPADERLPYSSRPSYFPPKTAAISPDGEWVYFNQPGSKITDTLGCDGNPVDVYRVRLDGSEVQQVTAGDPYAQGEEWFDLWSPDGEWLLYTAFSNDCARWPSGIMRPDGSNAQSHGNFLGWAKTPHREFSARTLGFWAAILGGAGIAIELSKRRAYRGHR